VFVPKLIGMAKEPADMYVVDGNLAASVDDIYRLAAQLKVAAVYIDGAYLLRHKNARLDRFTKVAENTERMKQLTGDCGLPTFASWQFNREAAKKAKKGDEKVGLEDIGMSDAIAQCSSIVLGLFQEESVETMHQRQVDVLKGRNGEVGQFSINWLFDVMNFDEIIIGAEGAQPVAMEWL
jgi:replicative DNA helicase